MTEPQEIKLNWVQRLGLFAGNIGKITTADPEKDQALLQMVKEQAQKRGIAMPQVGICEFEDAFGDPINIYNAWNVGFAPPDVQLYSKRMADEIRNAKPGGLNEKQARFIVAHETEHTAHNTRDKYVAIGYLAAMFTVGVVALKSHVENVFQRGKSLAQKAGSFVKIALASMVASYGISVITLAWRRHMEVEADLGALRHTGDAEAAVSALTHINRENARESLDMAIAQISLESGSYWWTMPYPTTAKRQELIKKAAEEQNSPDEKKR